MENDLRTYIEKATEQLGLCTDVVKDLHKKFETPTGSEQKADLLIASEELAREVIRYLRSVNEAVWDTTD
jgi:hypothetical protein